MNIDKYLVFFAYLVRKLNLPHVLKYAFFLVIKNRDIKVKTEVNYSGAKIIVNLGEFIGYWIFMDGCYEENWIKQAARIVENKVLIDIGANIGIYPLSLFRQAKAIYAIEPETVSHNSLVKNIKLNRITNIKTFRLAVTDSNSKSQSIYINVGNRGLSSLKIPYTEGTETVVGTTLDEFIRKNRITNIGLVKIDVEGSELDVIAGADHTLRKIGPPILIEFNGKILGLSGQSPEKLYESLIKYNYQATKLSGEALESTDISELSPTMNFNLLFRK